MQKNITENKWFWKSAKHIFSKKVSDNEKMALIEQDKIVLEENEAVAQRYSVKKVLLEISQDSHENTSARCSF